MPSTTIVAALARVTAVMTRRPDTGLHDDVGAVASWDGGTRTVCRHPSGRSVVTDMPRELGGLDSGVSPGWLVRAGLASCAVTCVVFAAARAGVRLRTLDVAVDSRADTRGMLRLPDVDGGAIDGGPRDLRLRVRVAADDIDDDALRALVDDACRHSPMSLAVVDARPIALEVVVAAAATVAAGGR